MLVEAVGGEMLGPLDENIDWMGEWTSVLMSVENIDCGGAGGDMVTSDCLLGAELLVNIGLRSGDALR